MEFKRSHIFILFVLLLILLCLIVYVVYIRDKNDVTETPDFEKHFLSSTSTPASFRTIDGEVITPTIDEATLTVVTSWASWSPYSPTEFAVLAGLREQFDSSVLNLILLNRKESPNVANRFLQQNPAPAGVAVIIDEEDIFYSQIEGYTMPETVVYNRNGEAVLHLRGPISHDRIVHLLQTVE